jgi:hypothetical protein
MKRILMAAAAVVMATPASAQLATVCVSCPTEVQEIIRQAQRMGEYAKMLQQGQQQIQEAQMMYNAVTGVRDIGSAASALGVLGIQNPLPINPWAAQSLMNGTGGTQGMVSSLGSLYSGASTANQVYVPSIRGWVGDQLRQQQQGIAGNQAMQLQLYQAAGQRAAAINDLRARMAVARDPATREALAGQISAVQADIANQQAQSMAVMGYGQQQIALREQQREEYLQQQIDRELAEGRARGFIQ